MQEHDKASSLRDQMEYGSIHGVADPFGFGASLDDDVEDATKVMGDRRTQSHNRLFSGEPLSDMLVRGWDAADGIPQVQIQLF